MQGKALAFLDGETQLLFAMRDVEADAFVAVDQRQKHGFSALLGQMVQGRLDDLRRRQGAAHDLAQFEPAQPQGIAAQRVLHEEAFRRKGRKDTMHDGVLNAARLGEFAHAQTDWPGVK